jgi:hypothetical protein
MVFGIWIGLFADCIMLGHFVKSLFRNGLVGGKCLSVEIGQSHSLLGMVDVN